MKTRAAVISAAKEDWRIEDIEMDDPRAGEVVVKLGACGMCHSDEHARSGDMAVPSFPIIGGHEGAGEIIEIGPGVTSVKVGDHVAFSFVPACGRCRFCAQGMSYLCDGGAKLFNQGMMTDGRIAHRLNGQAVARYGQLGAFSEIQLLSELSVVKVDRDIPLTAVALTSCGVSTGYGSAVDRAGTVPGDNVVVVGVGGVGIGALQGAALAGAGRIIAIDPLESRRESAKLFGATDVFASMEEAMDPVRELTRGVMADRVILTAGRLEGDMIQPALELTRKAGVCVVTSVAAMQARDVKMDLFMFSMMNKSLLGSIYGSSNPRQRIPFLLDLYKRGLLKLDEMITRTYTLDDINQGYADQNAGTITRGVIEF